MRRFEQTDPIRATEILGDTVCARGNAPAALLITSTPDEVGGYCKTLIAKVGKGGGFIVAGAASIPDEAKPLSRVLDRQLARTRA